MSNHVIYDPNANKKNFSRIYGVVFIVLIIALVTVLFTLIRTDAITNSVLKKKNIPFLLIISDDNGPVMTEAVLFNAKTLRLAIIDVPQEAGDLLPDLKRSDRFSVYYQQGDKEAYKRSVEQLLSLNFLFTLDLKIDQQVKLIDLLEGIRLYFFAPIDRIHPTTHKRYIYHAGEQFLDGDQSRDFLYAGVDTVDYQTYLEHSSQQKSAQNNTRNENQDNNGALAQAFGQSDDAALNEAGANSENVSILRHKNLRYARELLLGIVSTLKEYRAEREKYISLIYSYFQTDLSKRSFRKLLLYLSEIDVKSAEVIFQDYLGKQRLVQGKQINFPVYDGQVIRSQVVRISTQLQSHEIIAEQYPVRVEILNGTGIYLLAAKTAAIYSRENFDVVNVDNADRSDYDKTLVINLHSNSLEDVRRVAKVIGTDNVILQPLPGGEQAQAEVRIVLGKDFDGERIAK